MGFHKIIKTKGESSQNIGFFVPKMFRLDFSLQELKQFGFEFLKERLSGWTIWWVRNEEEYVQAIEALDELKNTYVFTYEVIE